MTATDIPPEAAGRLGGSTFTSGLSIPDFAATLRMGMRPVGLVQGYCVMRWSWYLAGSPYSSSMFWSGYSNNRRLSSYGCPHFQNYGYNQPSAEHRTWGANIEQTWVSDAWNDGYNTAFRRMIEEAQAAGAHGVVGVVDTNSQLVDVAIREFHIYGTAVVIDGVDPPERIWTTFLAGERLAKLVEAGLFPVSVVASLASIRIWASCATEILLHGRNDMSGAVSPSQEIIQISDCEVQARRVSRDHLKRGLGSDLLHGATFEDGWEEIHVGDFERSSVMRGNRMRRFRDAEPLTAPVPTVILR